jgi:hypothetical protein
MARLLWGGYSPASAVYDNLASRSGKLDRPYGACPLAVTRYLQEERRHDLSREEVTTMLESLADRGTIRAPYSDRWGAGGAQTGSPRGGCDSP